MFPQTLYYRFKRFSPSLYSSAHWREYGMLYRNTADDAHSANHAVILNPDCDVNAALQDVERFYGARCLTPRVFSGFVENEAGWLLPALVRRGYRIDHFGSTGFLYKGTEEFAPDSAVEPVHELTAELMCFAPDWLPDPARPHSKSYGLRAEDGCLCAYAAVEYGYDCAFITNVLTDESYRRRGYCTRLMKHIIHCHRQSHGSTPLFLDAVNENAVRIYTRLGFVRFATPDYWRASLQGK